MKTDNELEALLRATLSSRAAEVTEAADVPPRTSTRPRRWLPAIAAAAVIAAIAGTAVGIRVASHHGPAGPSPTPTHTRSASPSPTQPPDRMNTCAAKLPASWRAAITQGASRFGAVSAFPLAISPDGKQLLVARDFGTSRDVAVVGTSGAPRPIYSVLQPDLNRVEHASIDGHYALIDIERLPRNANGVDGTVLEVVLVDLRNLHATLLDSVHDSDITNGRRTIDGSVLADGQAYWDVKNRYADRTGVLRDYDVVTGRFRDAFSGTVGAPTLTPLGLGLPGDRTIRVLIARDVPTQVLDAVTTDVSRNSLSTDGSSYAWVSGRHIEWWAPGQSQITEFAPTDVVPGLIAVAGHYVMYEDPSSDSVVPIVYILDTSTGAVGASVNALQAYSLSNAGVFVGYRYTGSAKNSPTEPVRIDTTKLPGLHC